MIVLRQGVENYKNLCREKRYTVRPFKFDPAEDRAEQEKKVALASKKKSLWVSRRARQADARAIRHDPGAAQHSWLRSLGLLFAAPLLLSVVVPPLFLSGPCLALFCPSAVLEFPNSLVHNHVHRGVHGVDSSQGHPSLRGDGFAIRPALQFCGRIGRAVQRQG